MEVLAVTIFVSLILAIFFVIMFVATQRTRRSVEQEALLPFDDGNPFEASAAASPSHDSTSSL